MSCGQCPEPSPCAAVCPVGLCDDIRDADKVECAECAACHAEDDDHDDDDDNPHGGGGQVAGDCQQGTELVCVMFYGQDANTAFSCPEADGFILRDSVQPQVQGPNPSPAPAPAPNPNPAPNPGPNPYPYPYP